MKKILKISLMILIITTITGCGNISEEAKKNEINYKEMVEKDFKLTYDKEYIIKNDKTVEGSFTSFGKKEKTEEHIIDAVLKDDPTFNFRICTGYSEVPTLKVEYNYVTNYKNILVHRLWNKTLPNNDIVKLVTQTKTSTAYSSCEMEEYDDYLVFNPSNSIEEIANVLYKLNFNNVNVGDIDFTYGDIHDCISIKSWKNSPEIYVDSINQAIEYSKHPDERSQHYCP